MNAMYPMPVEQEEPSLVRLPEILRALSRRKLFLLVCVFIAVGSAATYIKLFVTPTYRATTTLIRSGQPNSPVAIDAIVPGLSADTIALNTEVEILYSYALLERVVKALNLHRDKEFVVAMSENASEPSPFDRLETWLLSTEAGTLDPIVEATLRLRDLLEVRNLPSSLVFEISIETSDPQKSKKIVDYLADLYIKDQLDAKFEASKNSTAWLADRVAELEGELSEAEQSVAEFVANGSPIDRDILAISNAALSDVRAKIQGIADHDSASRSRILRSAEGRSEQLQAVVELGGDRQLEQLGLRLGGVTGGAIARAFDSRFQALLVEIERGYAPNADKLMAYRQSERELVVLVAEQSARLLALEQLQREATSSRLTYELFLTRLKETSIQQGVQSADSRVLSYAILPNAPSHPRLLPLAGLSAIIGFVLGASSILFHNRTPRTWKLHGVDFLAGVPRFTKGIRGREINERKFLGNGHVKRKMHEVAKKIEIQSGPQVISMTSWWRGNASAVNAVALARSFSEIGRKVIFVNTNFDQFSMIKSLSNKAAVSRGGAKEFNAKFPLLDISDVWGSILKSEKYGIDYIQCCSGQKGEDLLSEKSLQDLVEYLRACYDIVILETSALGQKSGITQFPFFADYGIFNLLNVGNLESCVAQVEASYSGGLGLISLE